MSLTSYPPRFQTLALTLKSLLSQSVRPDRVLLWIARDDFAELPRNVLRLQRHGLTIRSCDDLKSYKKVIPLLSFGEDDFLVIADDDVFYYNDWLRDLSHAYQPGVREVICTRARRIRLNSNRAPEPYMEWDTDVERESAGRLIFPTGVGGVLYPSGIFHSDVTRVDVFQELCPSADDVWLYWMAAMNGAAFRRVGPRKREITWARTQHVALFEKNKTANDEQVAAMIARYGLPWKESV